MQPKVLSEGELIDINDEGGEDRGVLKELMLAKPHLNGILGCILQH